MTVLLFVESCESLFAQKFMQLSRLVLRLRFSFVHRGDGSTECVNLGRSCRGHLGKVLDKLGTTCEGLQQWIQITCVSHVRQSNQLTLLTYSLSCSVTIILLSMFQHEPSGQEHSNNSANDDLLFLLHVCVILIPTKALTLLITAIEE